MSGQRVIALTRIKSRAPEIGTFARDVVESALGFRRHMKTLSNVRRDAEDLPQTFSNVRRGSE